MGNQLCASGSLKRFVRRVLSTRSVHTVGARVLILQPTEQAYRALQQARDREQTPEFRAVYAKRAGVEGTIAQAVRTAVREKDANVPISDISTQAQRIDQSMSQERTFATLCTCFALLAVLIAWAAFQLF